MPTETPYQTAISTLDTLKSLLTPDVTEAVVRADIDEAEEHLAHLRTLPASVANCSAISHEQKNIAALRRKLTDGQSYRECRILLSLLERKIVGLPGGPAANPKH